MFFETLYHIFCSCLLQKFNTDLIPGLPDDLALECLLRVPIYEFSKVASVCRNWKREVQRPEFWQRRKAAALASPIVVMAQAKVDRYSLVTLYNLFESSSAAVYRLTICDPERNCWHELPPIPGFPNGLPMSCGIVGVGLDVVVIGGCDPVSRGVLDTVFIYNFLSGTWRQGANMPFDVRMSFGCASDSDKMVLVAGGNGYYYDHVLQSAMVYNVVNDKWIQLPDMEKKRDECQCVYRHGKFYVMGGYRNHRRTADSYEKSTEIFDFATWQWSLQHEEDFLMSTKYSRACVDGVDGTLYVCQNNEVVALEDASSWQVVACLPRELRSGYHLGAWDNKLVVFGRSAAYVLDEKNKTCAAYVLDVNNNTWTKLEVPVEYSGRVDAGCSLVM